MQNDAGTRIQNQHKINTAGSGSVHAKEEAASAKKNPDMRASAVGASNDVKAVGLPRNRSPKRRRNAMSLYANPSHKAAARMLGYALTLGTFSDWQAASYVWANRLSRTARVALAWAALTALSHEDAEAVVAAAFGWEVSA